MAGPAQLVIEAFENKFRSTPDLFRAPGRVNLIGEHTDYNLGFVLPVAVDMACYTASAPNRLGLLRIFSLNTKDGREWLIERIPSLQRAGEWSDYVIGVIRQIPQSRGLDIMIYSTVPVGSGLSSSASLEVSTALAAGWTSDFSTKLELAQLCKRAENEFVGVPSGIMDQYVSVFGQENAAVRIDCRSLEHKMVRLPEGVSIVAVNSMVKHQNASGAYGQRVAECRRATEIMGVKSLRDATMDRLGLIEDPVVLRRARHVITENRRVEAFVEAAANGNVERMGGLFVESHRSMQFDYEISCEELDYLVDAAIAIDGVYGARMTGGGFGGCTVNLVDASAALAFEGRISGAYRARYGKEPAIYRIRPSGGASRLS